MRRFSLVVCAAALGALSLWSCGRRETVVMAPPVNSSQPMAPMSSGQPMAAAAPMGSVYNWQDVPLNQQIPVTRAIFDQGGYQIYAATGETIVVPFVNQNLYVMKFGRSDNGQPFFVNGGDAPVLYLPPGGYLENAAASGARWYPIPEGYAYNRPIYVSVAPSWNDYVGMGWYPGMYAYGGMWGYSPVSHFVWMPSVSFFIGGRRYYDYNSYHSYYTRTPGYVRTRVVNNYYNTPRSTGSFGVGRSTGSFGTGRVSGSLGSTGSFGTGRRSSGFGNSSTGSFGTGRSSGGFTSPSNTGSFGTGRSTGGFSGSFGGGATSGGSSFNNSGRSSGSSFGGTRSFGGGGSSFSGGSRSSGSSFGGGSSSGGRSSGSFGGGGRSSGGSFGGGRRR